MKESKRRFILISVNIIERKLCHATSTVLTNLCLVEDLRMESSPPIPLARALQTGYAFLEVISRKVKESLTRNPSFVEFTKTGLTIGWNSSPVKIVTRRWRPLYCLCYRATNSRPTQIIWRRKFLRLRKIIRKVGFIYDMPFMEVED